MYKYELCMIRLFMEVENKELVVSLFSFVSFLVKARYLDAYAFHRFETTTSLD